MTDSASEFNRAIHRAANLLKGSRRTVALTGAGISTTSGIPDFRSQGSGLWTRYEPMEVASLTAFRCHPEKFFAWFHPLARQMVLADPNPAHLALARLEGAGYIKTVITQNIDGLHSRAGSGNVLELHGTLSSLTCTNCFQHYDSAHFLEDYLEHGTIPLCPSCGQILKPDVILYEEQLPYRVWQDAEEASRSCDLMLIAGTSLEVMPSAGLPIRAIENGAHLILVNRTATYMDVRADVIFHKDVADVIPLIADEVLSPH